MKASELRQRDDRELQGQLREINETIMRLKFQLSMGQTDALKKYRALKKDRARILTILNERKRQKEKDQQLSKT